MYIYIFFKFSKIYIKVYVYNYYVLYIPGALIVCRWLCAVYTIIGSDEELPLGEEFQGLVRCFINGQEKKPERKFLPAAKLLEQLA